MGGYGYDIMGGTNNKIGFYSNGLFLYGNLISFETKFCQVLSGNTWTFLSGSTVNLNGTLNLTGTSYFTSPDQIYVNGTTTLPDYIKQNGSSLISFPKSDWSDITNKPSTFPPSSHNHDDRYYTADYIYKNYCETNGTTITNIKNRLSALEAKI